MKTLRWIACIPGAMIASLLTWVLVKKLFPSAQYGFGFAGNVVGLFPLALAAAIPTVVFIVTAVVVSPHTGRGASFVFFGLSFLLSLGGMDAVLHQVDPVPAFWLTTVLGMLAGAISGLLISLRLQRRRGKKKPNKTPEPTPMSVTPPATQESRRP
jgi:hypothetical protein